MTPTPTLGRFERNLPYSPLVPPPPPSEAMVKLRMLGRKKSEEDVQPQTWTQKLEKRRRKMQTRRNTKQMTAMSRRTQRGEEKVIQKFQCERVKERRSNGW